MEDQVVIQQYYELRSCRAVAELYQCNQETIRRLLKRNGIDLTGWKRTPEYALPKKRYPHKTYPRKYTPVAYHVTCQCCGKEFEAHNKRSRYCSRKCKDVGYKREHGQDSRLEPRHVTCVICGKEFDTRIYTKITCSPECGAARIKQRSKECDRNRPNRDSRQYEHTREEWQQIIKERAKQRAEREAVEKAWYKALHTVERECAECGALFYCLDKETRRTCSTECSRRYKNRRADKRVPVDQQVDRITLKKLFKRDNGICYLCGCECDWNDWKTSQKGNTYPGDKYPTIEHVIPISKGGLNAWDNVRLACWKCNLDKADGIIKIQPMSREHAYSEKYSGTQKKRTAQYTLDGELIRIWDSTAQIKRELGLNDSHIQSVCRGHKSKTGNAYGFHWEYVS